LQEGHEVHVLLRPEQEWRLVEVQEDIVRHQADLEDQQQVARCVRLARPQWIFHLATYGAYSQQVDRERIYRTNVLGVVNLVTAARSAGVEVMVNTGSSSEYGFKDHAPAEGEVPEPNSDYAVSKTSATMFCQHTARKEGWRIPTLRLYSVYGPYEEPTRFIPRLVVAGLKGQLPPLVDGSVARDFVFVEDVCDAYVAAARAGGEDLGPVFNVGSGQQTTIAEAVSVARDLFKIAEEPKWDSFAKRSWDTSTWISDPTRIGKALGWRAKVGLREGLHRTADWLRRTPCRGRYEN
jgi:dolichol-phosphate mannosyltransferase